MEKFSKIQACAVWELAEENYGGQKRGAEDGEIETPKASRSKGGEWRAGVPLSSRLDSFRQPRQSCLDSPPNLLVSSSLLSSPLSSSITPSLYHSRLKTYIFNKSFPPYTSFTYRTAFMTTGLNRTYHAHRFIFSFTF